MQSWGPWWAPDGGLGALAGKVDHLTRRTLGRWQVNRGVAALRELAARRCSLTPAARLARKEGVNAMSAKAWDTTGSVALRR